MASLDNVGIHVTINLLPEFVRAGDRYWSIPAWARWAFRGRRREYMHWLAQQQQRVICDVMDAAGKVMDNG